jgi:predicted enzyme involved in methoxymalonyl-ACP biosynthesis
MAYNHEEYGLQKSICKYLELQYNHVMFLSDAISNVSLTRPQQVRNTQIQKRGFSCPDLMIFAPRNGYHGLFLELKKCTPYKKNGELSKQMVKVKDESGRVTKVYDHLEEQDRALRTLRKEGYKAEFCWSLDMAIGMIREYMNEK